VAAVAAVRPSWAGGRRAGHGIAVLLRVYANCIDGHTDTNNHRIDQALDEGGDETS
jgi:hypothetical protein